MNDEVIEQVVENIVGGKKNVVLDATVLSSLMACPRLTDFRFNLNLYPITGKSNSLECGSIVHIFLEYFYGSIIKGVSREQAIGFGMAAAELYITGCRYCKDFTPIHGHASNQTLGVEPLYHEGEHRCTDQCVLKPVCGHKANEFPGVVNTPKEDETKPYPRIGWHWVLDTCQQYVDFYRADHWVPLFVEQVKGKVLYEDDEVRILWKAKLDWGVDTNQGIYPVDHKTMKQNRDNLKMNNQFMGQCLVMGTQRMIINKIGFQKSLKPEEKFMRKMMPYSMPHLLEWQSEILPYYAKLLLMYAETGYFPPNYTSCEGKYGNCAFAGVCGSDPAMREEELKLHFIVGPQWNPTNDEDL